VSSHLSFASEQPFSAQDFERLRQQGSPILVYVHADWCATCVRQASILSELLSRDKYKPLELLRVDFDRQKPVVSAFGVRYQSTLIVFREGKEVGRSTADVNKSSIAELLERAL
jgi:thioredoxin-like negative regulator of GroEL